MKSFFLVISSIQQVQALRNKLQCYFASTLQSFKIDAVVIISKELHKGSFIYYVCKIFRKIIISYVLKWMFPNDVKDVGTSFSTSRNV